MHMLQGLFGLIIKGLFSSFHTHPYITQGVGHRSIKMVLLESSYFNHTLKRILSVFTGRV